MDQKPEREDGSGGVMGGKWGRGEEAGGKMRREEGKACPRFEMTGERDSFPSYSHVCTLPVPSVPLLA